MKSIIKCPICNHEITQGSFAFPKLPKSSKYSYIFGQVHVECLQSHAERVAIQNELKRIYLEVFENHPNFPIVAQLNYILIKSRPDSKLFEIYNFEDFVEFYLPYVQVEELLNMNIDQELGLGPNKWTKLVARNDGYLMLSYDWPNSKFIENISLPNLSLKQLKCLITEALSVAQKLGHLSEEFGRVH
jgi:hypothetical protein